MPGPHTSANRTFVIGGLFLFVFGLLLIAQRRNLFTPVFEVYAEFDRLNGLQKGANVRVSGMDAGQVLDAEVPSRPDRRFRLKLRIREEFHPLVRADSLATIRTAGLSGSTFVDIQKGTQDSAQLREGSTIPGTEPFDIGDLIQQGSGLLKATQSSVSDLHDTAGRALEAVALAAKHADNTVLGMSGDLQKLASSARQTSEEAGELMAQIDRRQGVLGKLLKDRKLADLVDQTVRNSSQSATNLNHASAQLDTTISEFRSRDLLRRAEALLENSRQLTATLNQAVNQVAN